MKRKLIIGVTLAVAVVFAAGCINYEQEIYLNADGSGTVIVRYTSDDPEGNSGTPILPFTEDEIIAEYKGSNLVVRDVVPDADNDEYSAGVTYQIDFDDVTDLNDYGIFSVGDKLTQTFYLNDLGDTVSYMQTTSLTMDVEDTSMLDSYKFTYKLICPADVTETNGTLSADGRTVAWLYTLPELINNAVDMTATYEKPAGAPGGGIFSGAAGEAVEKYVIAIDVIGTAILTLLIIIAFAIPFVLSKRFRKTVLEFFVFERWVGPLIIKVLYPLGLVVITVGGAFNSLSGLTALLLLDVDLGILFIFIGAVIVIVGNLVWRAACEFFFLFFDMRETLTAIKGEKVKADADTR
ncbi:MAG: DUF4282 domain-containing protein [Candidatus Coatesbacteria bacterium]|nr:MAG: DUF4282 domain-containing protein [Candidatus Coatesbacteria bacterium]